MKRITPWIILSVFAIYLAAAAFTPDRTPDGFRIGEFARLPVVINNRVQPIDSVARAARLRIRDTSEPVGRAWSWQRWTSARTFEDSEWLLELLTKPDAADARRIFPIHDPALLTTLHLSAAPDGRVDYSYAELKPGLQELAQQGNRIASMNAAGRAAWEAECLSLRNAVAIYDRLKNTLQPNSFWQSEAQRHPGGGDFAAQLAQYQSDLRASLTEVLGAKEGKSQAPDPARAQRMDAFARPFLGVSRAALFSIVPVRGQTRTKDRWQNTGEIVGASLRTGQLPSAVTMLAGMSSAFARGNASEFNDQIAKYRQWLTERRMTPAMRWARYEVFSTTFQPLARALTIYLVAVLLLGASRMSGLRELSRAAVNLTVLAFLVHTAGLFVGMTLGGRAAFANLANGIQLVGWAAVLVAGVAELRWRNGAGATAAAVAGLLTLAVGQSLGPGTRAELVRLAQATGFWLALAATAIVVASYFARASGRSRSTDDAVGLGVAGNAIGSAA